MHINQETLYFGQRASSELDFLSRFSSSKIASWSIAEIEARGTHWQKNLGIVIELPAMKKERAEI